jgi:polysaccharide export outer membrane protein
LQVDDNITINLKSKNDELVSFFRKTEGTGTGNVNAESAYFSGFSVDVHGNISIPYIGELNVLGYTTTEVRKKLESEIKKYFKSDNEIFITVKLSGIKYTIIGEIGQPGTNIILQNNVNILEAIANSGDITIYGDRKTVEVFRTTQTGQEKFLIDLTKIDAYDSEIFYLKPNDFIQIKPIKQKSLGIGTTGLQSLTTIVSVFSLLTSLIIISKNL